jgi:hypothetical protein
MIGSRTRVAMINVMGAPIKNEDVPRSSTISPGTTARRIGRLRGVTTAASGRMAVACAVHKRDARDA